MVVRLSDERPSAAAAVRLRIRSSRRLIHVGIAAGLTVALAIGSSLIEECGCPFQPSVLGVRGIRNVSHTVHLGDVRAKLVATADEELAVNRLPAAWVERIRAAGEVDAIPWELSFVAANGLSWRPNPVIQTYHAYTEGLDQAVADHIANDGPPHLLVQFLDFDGRYPLWSSPEMWIAILSNYELVDTLPFVPGREPVALMARRPEPLELGLERAHAAEAELGEWFAVPERDEAVFASIDLYRDLEGWLASLFWHTDPLLFEFRFEDGRIYTTRMLPGTAGGRHLANYPPLIFEQLVWLLEGKLPPKATAFRIIGPGSESFESRVRVTWWTSTWNPAATADAVP